MSNSVASAHPLLYHYTTAAGLQGIIESQTLWATNIAYLNDVEKHTGFFDRRLPQLLGPCFDEMATSEDGQRRIECAGGKEQVVEQFRSLLLKTSLSFNKPYVTSFCTSSSDDVKDDGLLSQWRGYGVDGGYAIAFETQNLEQLFLEEGENFHYTYGGFGNVAYFGQDTGYWITQPETKFHEKRLMDVLREFLKRPCQEVLENLYVPLTALSCMHKHNGFREEAEVRIVVVPTNETVLSQSAQQEVDSRFPKPVRFVVKNGVLVPYIALFEHLSKKDSFKLPIIKIIIGPSPNKSKREAAAKLLLELNGMNPDIVVVSDIPYLGR